PTPPSRTCWSAAWWPRRAETTPPAEPSATARPRSSSASSGWRVSRSCRASTTSEPTPPRSAIAPTPWPGSAPRSPPELLDDAFGLFLRERAQGLGLLGAVAAQPGHDLERRLVVRRLEDLDDVVAAQRHPDPHEPPAGLLDLPLAVLDPVAPRGQS